MRSACKLQQSHFFVHRWTNRNPNLSVSSSTYHDGENSLFWGGNEKGDRDEQLFVIDRLIAHKLITSFLHKHYTANRTNVTKEELVYLQLYRHQLSREWRSRERRRCCTPCSDAPATPSPCYLEDDHYLRLSNTTVSKNTNPSWHYLNGILGNLLFWSFQWFTVK